MGSDRHFAWQQFSGPNVRFGSKADIEVSLGNVRFPPKSGPRRQTAHDAGSARTTAKPKASFAVARQVLAAVQIRA